MSSPFIVVNHGGYWIDNTYNNGHEECILIPQGGLTYSELLEQIIEIVGKEPDRYKYAIYTLVEIESKSVKFRIKNDNDFVGVSRLVGILRLYIETTLRSSVGHVNDSFVNLLNSQNALAKTQVVMHDIGNVNDETDVEPDNFETNLEDNESVDADDFNEDDGNGDDFGGGDYGSDWGCDDDTFFDEDGEEVPNDDEANDIDACCTRASRPTPPLARTENDTDDMEDSSTQETCQHGHQWIIPGARYQSSLPVDRLGVDVRVGFVDTLHMGAIFDNKDSLITALGLYHLRNRVEYRISRSSKTRFAARCKHKDECTFSMRASSQGDQWRVFQWIAPHSCLMDLTRCGKPTIPSRIIGAFFSPSLLNDGAILRPKEMQMQLQRDYGVRVEYRRALAGRNHAIKMIYGDNDKSFQLLPSYLYMVQQSNPGSVVDLQTDDSDRFRYVYMSLAASINGFLEYGRPVIVIDATHLKGKYKGVMFVAATHDGNDQIYPLAIGIGDKEMDTSWTWFLRQVRITFGCPDNLLFVSDQHRSITNAVAEVYPGTPHALCAYHVQNNLKNWGANIVAMYQNAAYCYRFRDFDRVMANLKVASENGAYKKLIEADPTRWARCKCPVRRYSFCMTSNPAECLNGRLRWARRLPVCTLFECYRDLVQSWFYDRRTLALQRVHVLAPEVAARVARVDTAGASMPVRPISATKFKVSMETRHYTVDLATRTCTCEEFQGDLIPCVHAAAAIGHARHSINSYVWSYYTTENLRGIYSGDVMPVPHPNDWDVPIEIRSRVVLAPSNPRQAGRPRRNRMQAIASRARRIRTMCSRCHQPGHNRATCTTYMPNSQESQVGSNETNAASTSRTRRPPHCSTCHQPGHTRITCPNGPNGAR